MRFFSSIGTAFVSLFSGQHTFRMTAFVSLIVIGIMVALPIMKILPRVTAGEFIPLHYNVYFGVDEIGPWYRVFILPALGMFLLIVNVVFEAMFLQHEHVVSYFFAYGTIATEFILLLAVALITVLNL